MQYPRNAESRLRRLSETFPAVVMTGARQAGKTTLLRMAFPDHDYVSLDLPAAANQAERNPDTFLDVHPSYLATYIERDVRQLLNVQSLQSFERFLRVLAARSATQVHKSNLASQVGISVGTVTNWLSVLEASGQIALLEPWHTNLGKRVARTPRVYFRDTGLLCFLLNLDDPGLLLRSPFLGGVWETFVFAELRKTREVAGRPFHIWTYRDHGQREIDFVLERAGELSFVECKWEETPGPGEARTIRKVSADLAATDGPWRAGSHYVVSRPRASYDISPGIRAIGVRDLHTVTR